MKKRNQANRNQLIYLISGIAFLLFSIYLNWGYLNRGDFPDALLFVAVGISQLGLAYLAPHIFPKDERARTIREKAMNVNYFIMLIVIIVMIVVSGQADLTAFQALTIVGSLYLLSAVFSMIFFAKRV